MERGDDCYEKKHGIEMVGLLNYLSLCPEKSCELCCFANILGD